MLRNSLIFLVSFCVAIAVFVWAENQIAPSFQACISRDVAKQSGDDPIIGVIKTQAICSLRLIDRHNGFFAALAALIVAAFTGTLWVATDRLAKSGQRAFEATERAFVFIDGFNVELTTAADTKAKPDYETLPQWYQSHPELYITRFALQPRWKNGGNTPTKKMTIQVDWRGPPGPVPPPNYVYRNRREPFFLAPKAIEPSAMIEVPTAVALVKWAMSPVGVEPFILVWGRADYEDVFGQKHFVEWCHRLRFSRTGGERMSAGFIQWGDYNRSDEDDRA